MPHFIAPTGERYPCRVVSRKAPRQAQLDGVAVGPVDAGGIWFECDEWPSALEQGDAVFVDADGRQRQVMVSEVNGRRGFAHWNDPPPART